MFNDFIIDVPKEFIDKTDPWSLKVLAVNMTEETIKAHHLCRISGLTEENKPIISAYVNGTYDELRKGDIVGTLHDIKPKEEAYVVYDGYVNVEVSMKS